jgi:hypothetical protein
LYRPILEVIAMAKLDHLGLLDEDSKRAAAWYVDILGLHTEFEIPDAGVTAVRDSSDFTIFLNESNGTHAEGTLYFQVDSVDALTWIARRPQRAVRARAEVESVGLRSRVT